MASDRLIKYLRIIAINDFKQDEIVDIKDISRMLKRYTRKICWSSNEIAGAMPKVSSLYVPTGEKNIYGLNTFIINSDENA